MNYPTPPSAWKKSGEDCRAASLPSLYLTLIRITKGAPSDITPSLPRLIVISAYQREIMGICRSLSEV